MSGFLVDPADPPERQRDKLLQIAEVLMRRVEQVTDDSGLAYAQFQRAAMLEDEVRQRTRDLEGALDQINRANARLAEANRATEAARQNLANAIETVQEGFALFDADDVLVMCNSRFGMQLADVRAALRPGLGFADYVDRVSRSRWLALPGGETPAAWAEARKRRHREPHVVFNVGIRPDRWLQVSEHRTRDGGTVILQTDVTEIIRSERLERGKLLDDQARMIRATLDHIDQGVCIFDSAHRLVGWNERLGGLLAIPLTRLRLGVGFGYVLELLEARADFGDGFGARGLRDWVAMAGARPPLRFALRQGGARVLDAFAQEMPDRGFVVSFGDVTAERNAIAALSRANETLEARVAARTLELEDALAQAERASAARSRFVAAASHDLLQPLSAAKLFIASIGDEPASPRAREALEKTQNALASVEAILEALLDISRLESGKAAVSVGPVPLDRLLGPMRDEFAPLAARKGLGLTVRPCPAEVLTDAAYLRRILQNLIGNAVRYTRRGRVLVGVRRRDAGVRIEVHDTGPGIPPEEQANVFREFHRLDARASASEGLGLGLAIVERAAAILGHPLRLMSRVGHGTSVALDLPLAEPAPQAATETAGRAPGGDRIRDRIVLLVENDDDLRQALTLLLEGWGASVLDAAGGEAALALIEEIGIPPDVLLVDQHLGAGIGGLDLVAALRARHGPLPARIITADRGEALRRACAAAPAGVLYKPIDTRALRAFLADPGGGGG